MVIHEKLLHKKATYAKYYICFYCKYMLISYVKSPGIYSNITHITINTNGSKRIQEVFVPSNLFHSRRMSFFFAIIFAYSLSISIASYETINLYVTKSSNRNSSLLAMHADPNLNKHHCNVNKSCLMLLANQLLDIFNNSISSNLDYYRIV